MGISGLLPALKSIIEPQHVRKYAGQKVAVDTYCWLHRGTYSCALELCTGAPTDKYIQFVIDRVKMLQFYKVTPIMVFDGNNLPSKSGTENERHSSRAENKSKGMQALRSDNRAAAVEYFQRAVDVTPLMAHKCIKALRKMGVECIVAPYEADAQLAYLNTRNFVSAVITEDSDIIAFGAKVVFFKMDKEGNGEEYRQKLLGACSSMNLTGWRPEHLTQMCIFAGCDYLKSLSGMGIKFSKVLYMVTLYGIKKAFNTMQAVNIHSLAPEECYVRAIKNLALQGPVPTSYLDEFRQAYLTFQYQRVYDPEKECLATMKEIPPDNTMEMPFIGAHLPADIAQAVGTGRMNPCTHQYWEDTLDAKPVPKVLPRGVCGGGESAEGAEVSGAGAGQTRSVKQAVIDFKPQSAGKASHQGVLRVGGSAANSHGTCSAPEVANRKAVEAGGMGGRDWFCPNCDATVFASKDFCYKCQTPKPAGSAGMGAEAMFRPASTGGADGGRSRSLSSSGKGQTKLSTFLPVSKPTLEDFKPPRPASASADGAQDDVLDDRNAWWRKTSSNSGGSEVGGRGEVADSDHVSDSEEGNSNDAHQPAGARADTAGGPSSNAKRKGQLVDAAGSSDGCIAGDGGALARTGGMQGRGPMLKRFKTSNPFARSEPAPGVASKFFGAAPGAREEETPNWAGQGDASSDACRDQEHRVQGARPGGLWTTVQVEDKKEADMDADKDDHAAVGALMQMCSYRGGAAPACASGASTQLSVHRYVSDLVLPSRNTSGSSLSRRNSTSCATTAKAGGQDLTPTASVGGTDREEFAPGSRGRDTSGCPIEALQYRSDPSKLYRPLGGGGGGGEGKRPSMAASSPAVHLQSSDTALGSSLASGRGDGGGMRGTPRISLAPKGPSSRGAFASSVDALAAFAMHTPPTVPRGRK